MTDWLSVLGISGAALVLLTLLAPAPAVSVRRSLAETAGRIVGWQRDLVSAAVQRVADAAAVAMQAVPDGVEAWVRGLAAIGRAWGQVTRHCWVLIAEFALFGPFVLAVYVDARAVELALDVIFGVPVTPAATGFDGLFAHPTHVVSAIPGGLLDWLQPVALLFGPVWQRDHGQIAVGLASLQAVLGLFMFWRFGSEAVELRPWTLLRTRPIPTAVFLLLCAVLTLLAGVRGYELTDQWWWGGALAAGLAAAMPWAMAYTLHFALDGPAAVVGLAIVAVTGCAATVLPLGISVLVSAVAIGSCAIALAGAMVAAATLGVLWLPFGAAHWIAEALLELPARAFGWRRAFDAPPGNLAPEPDPPERSDYA